MYIVAWEQECGLKVYDALWLQIQAHKITKYFQFSFPENIPRFLYFLKVDF